MEKHVSEAVIRRLPRYYRKIEELLARGVERISSGQLSEEMDLNASQIRRDFNCFGGFGQQGYGYSVEKLHNELRRIMGLDQRCHCIVIGAGNIGRALMCYRGFDGDPFTMDAVFDKDAGLIGSTIEGIPVHSMEKLDEFVNEHVVNVGVICTPRTQAQAVCDKLRDLGVRSVWNFAPLELQGADWMTIENVNMSDSLFILSYRMNAGRME